MKIILLSGGSGKRLWPLSGDINSKQFLKIMKNSSGDMMSMLQNTVAQLGRLGLLEDTLVTASAQQADLIEEQIGQAIPCLSEPERRDTFPAIALASAYLHSMADVSGDEVILVMPVDGKADISFYERAAELEQNLDAHPHIQLGLVGAIPTFPSEQYGYIQSHEPASDDFRTVSGFKEKPAAAAAARLIEENALWNCGVFAFRLRYMIEHLQERGFPTMYSALRSQYASLPMRSFDYEVVEHEPHIACLQYDGKWQDMGNWHAIADTMDEPVTGKGLKDSASSNTHILNDLSIPVLVSGIEDAIIVAGTEGILVCSKERAPAIKQLVEQVRQLSGDPEQARVTNGWSKLVDEAVDAPSSQTIITTLHYLPAGAELLPYDIGLHSNLTVTSGGGFIISQTRSISATAGIAYSEDGSLGFIASVDTRLLETVTIGVETTKPKEATV